MLGPDLLIGTRRSGRSNQQNDAIQNKPPKHARVFDYARIAKELPQEASHGSRGRSIRRANIDEKDA